jgi:hypothetical protein
MPLISVAVTLALGLAQPSAQSFAGTWTAALKGQTYARLELREANGTLSGRISLGAMHFDKDGVVDTVQEPATNFTPIFDVTVRDGIVAFARKDGDDTDRFEIRIVDGDVQLTFVLSAEQRETLAREGLPLLKPMRLVKTR